VTSQRLPVSEPPHGRLAAVKERGHVLLGLRWCKH
jgi:hypothetical protein